MSIHKYRVIDRTDIRPGGLSMILDKPNTLTCQDATTNDTPRDSFYIPVTIESTEIHHIPQCGLRDISNDERK